MKIVWDDTYAGPRWRYGLQYRPVGTGNVPDGWILKSDRTDERFQFGTLDWPRRLSKREVENFELVEVQQ